MSEGSHASQPPAAGVPFLLRQVYAVSRGTCLEIHVSRAPSPADAGLPAAETTTWSPARGAEGAAVSCRPPARQTRAAGLHKLVGIRHGTDTSVVNKATARLRSV